MATRALLSELAAAFGAASGNTVTMTAVGGVDAARRVMAGEAFDVVVLASDAIAKLAAAGRVLAGSQTDLVRSAVAVAVQAGAPTPDMASEAALRRAVLAARSIGFSSGPSGVQLTALFERWGIAAQVADRLVQVLPGVAVGSLVASGEVELGFQQLSELMHLRGITVLGELPPPVQLITRFSAAIATSSVQAQAARALLEFFAAPTHDAAKRRHGFAPA